MVRKNHRCRLLHSCPSLAFGCLLMMCAASAQKPDDFKNPYKAAAEKFRNRGFQNPYNMKEHGNGTLESALERAPKECHEKLRYQHERITTKLRLDYIPDEVAALKCSPEALAVVSTPGQDLGKMMALPERSDLSFHRGMYFENVGAGMGAGSGACRISASQKEGGGGETGCATSAGSGWGAWPTTGAAKGNENVGRGMMSRSLPPEIVGAGVGEPIAFFLVVHSQQSPRSLRRLVRALNRTHHSFLIHVDAKADARLHEAASQLEDQADNLRVLRPPRSVAWGGPSLLQVQLEGMRALVEWERVWRHWFFLSGSDYPIKSVDHMAHVLSRGPPVSYFEVFHQIPQYSGGRGLTFGWVECADYVYKVSSDKELPRGMHLWGGSAWITPSWDFSVWLSDCLFVRSNRKPDNFFESIEPDWNPDLDDDPLGECRLAVDFLEYSENLMSAEELYVHTVFMNSDHCVQVDPRYWRWVNWKGEAGKHCTRADWCGMSPLELEARDLRTALQTEAFFARKFGEEDEELLEMADSFADGDMFLLRLTITNASGSENKFRRQKTIMGPQGPIPLEAAALDGNEYTGWEVPFVPDAFFRADLEKDWDICGVTLTTNVPGPAFTIQAWSGRDPQLGWYDLLKTPGQNTEVPKARRDAQPWFMEHVIFPPKMAQSLIVIFPQSARTRFLQVFELQAHGCPPNPPTETINAMDPVFRDKVRSLKRAGSENDPRAQQHPPPGQGPPPGHQRGPLPGQRPPPGHRGPPPGERGGPPPGMGRGPPPGMGGRGPRGGPQHPLQGDRKQEL